MKTPRWGWIGAIAALLALTPLRAGSDVILSELCDPRDDFLTDRFIEIYNSGPGTVDLTGWKVVAVGNGSPIFTWNLSGTIAPDQALVCGDATTTVAFQVDFPEEAWSASNSTWNGKVGDGAQLLNASSTVIDDVLAPGTLFENMDMYRNFDVTTPNPVFTVGEWTLMAVDLPTQGTPGSHSAGSVMGPVIESIVTSPASPGIGQAVHVQADITDTATITGAEVHWGLSSGSLPNTIAMSVLAGDTYQTVSTIPAQAQGSTVFYEVEASNDLSGTTTSDEQSFDVPIVVSIATIQGGVSSSPYDGQTVLTSGVVTAIYGTTYVIQDGAGAWNGLWVRGAAAPAQGDTVTVSGQVSEFDGLNTGNTMLINATVQSSAAAAVFPAATALSTVLAGSEAYEGVLVQTTNAICTDPSLAGGEWHADDGSGNGRVGLLGYDANPLLGTTYDVRGPVAYSSDQFKIEPRDAADVVWVADNAAPVIDQADALTSTTVRVWFSEPVEFTTASNAANYTIPSLTVFAASLDQGFTDRVTLTVSTITTGDYTLTATGVEDLYGNATAGTASPFSFFDRMIPAGYYDPAEGLFGAALKTALHNIIDNHNTQSYAFAWTAFQSSDVRPDNGKVWDMYSDQPGGVPAYYYTFGVDQGGVGGMEGTGYNREHSWPSSWFGGNSPMQTDLFQLVPTDNYVNNQRGNFPYGETAAPTWTSTNGSQVGPCSVPGYSGVIFEPRDDFKGDFARIYFYFSARYEGEDGSWAGSPNANGAELTSWTIDMLLDWHQDDPVSLKEVDRNIAIYGFQNNRNPYVDRPEFVELVYGSAPVSVPVEVPAAQVSLYQNAPNPFGAWTRIAFDLPRPAQVQVQVFDVRGAIVTTLTDAPFGAGRHELRWNGRNDAGVGQAAGIYFYRLKTGGTALTRKLVLTD